MGKGNEKPQGKMKWDLQAGKAKQGQRRDEEGKGPGRRGARDKVVNEPSHH